MRDSRRTTAIPVDRIELHRQIGRKYRQVAFNPTAEYHFFTGRRAAEHIGYPESVLDDFPPELVEAFAGVADPFHWGMPHPGENVLDVGSGGGLDSAIAATAIGPEGTVIGVDMTSEMLERSRRVMSDSGLINVEFREGHAEDLPVPDQSVDLVISNGVLNLVPDKQRAYEEIHRVLRPGGRFHVADIVVESAIPEGARRDIDLWTG